MNTTRSQVLDWDEETTQEATVHALYMRGPDLIPSIYWPTYHTGYDSKLIQNQTKEEFKITECRSREWVQIVEYIPFMYDALGLIPVLHAPMPTLLFYLH